jgi:hypothetical protein
MLGLGLACSSIGEYPLAHPFLKYVGVVFYLLFALGKVGTVVLYWFLRGRVNNILHFTGGAPYWQGVISSWVVLAALSVETLWSAWEVRGAVWPREHYYERLGPA